MGPPQNVALTRVPWKVPRSTVRNEPPRARHKPFFMTLPSLRKGAELGAVCVGFLLFGCDREAPPGARRSDAPAAPQAGEPTLPPEVSPRKPMAKAVPDAGTPKAPHAGPWFV